MEGNSKGRGGREGGREGGRSYIESVRQSAVLVTRYPILFDLSSSFAVIFVNISTSALICDVVNCSLRVSNTPSVESLGGGDTGGVKPGGGLILHVSGFLIRQTSSR